MLLSRVLLCASWLVVFAAPRTLLAQVEVPVTTTDTADDDRARRLFEEGVALAEAGEIDQALVRFEEAFTLSPRASIAYNVAFILFSQGRPRAALDALNRADPFPMTAEERASIDALRERLRPVLATVVVAVVPPSATVCIDDACDVGSAPIRTIVVEAGTRVVRASAPGYEPGERSIAITAGQSARVTLALAALPPPRPRAVLDDAEDRARGRRRVRRGLLIGSGIAVALTGVLVGVLYPRDPRTPYSGIDFGQQP
jgi:tetratricopeptide (TPR) repeat protein